MNQLLTLPKPGSEAYNVLETNLKIIADAQWNILNTLIAQGYNDRFRNSLYIAYFINILQNTNDEKKVKEMQENRNNISIFGESNQEKTQQISNTIAQLFNESQRLITHGENLTNNPWYKSQNYVKTYLEGLDAKLISFEYSNIDELWLRSDIIIDYDKFLSLFDESNIVVSVYSNNHNGDYIRITLLQHVDDLIQSIKEYDHNLNIFDSADISYYKVKSEKLDQPAPSLLLGLKSNRYVDTKIQNNDDDEGYEFIGIVEEEGEDEIPQKYFDDQRNHQDHDNYGYEGEL